MTGGALQGCSGFVGDVAVEGDFADVAAAGGDVFRVAMFVVHRVEGEADVAGGSHKFEFFAGFEFVLTSVSNSISNLI